MKGLDIANHLNTNYPKKRCAGCGGSKQIRLVTDRLGFKYLVCSDCRAEMLK